MTSHTRGVRRERQTRLFLEDAGWVVLRTAGSLGAADLVTLRPHHQPRLVQVKATAAGPYEHFGPAERDRLSSLARRAGAEAWLLWWPPSGKPTWFAEAYWPASRNNAAPSVGH